uniref:FANCI_S1 domain-containing protein n=1 Tax=Caenorhabditis tropicalis TaxID=1561998 RepID=A0A1I7UL72_9PELO
MDTVVMSQLFTQASQPRRGGGTEKFVDSMINFRRKYPDSLEDVPETNRRAAISNLKNLNNNNKWQAIGRLIIQMCNEDRGGRLFEFSHAILSLLNVLSDQNEIESLTLRVIKFLMDVLTKADVSVPNFFGLYNDLIIQLENISKRGLIDLVEYVSVELREANQLNERSQEDEMDIENARAKSNDVPKTFNQRWKDFVSALVSKIRTLEEIEYNDDIMSGENASDQIIFDWLKITEDVSAFELLSDIASASSSTTCIDRFCDEVISVEIGVDTLSDEIEMEKKRRAIMTWKSIILTTKTEKEKLGRLWNGVICAWEIGEAEEKSKMENRKISEHLEKCLIVGQKVLANNVESAKKFLTFIRTDKYRILSSELGLSLALVQCGLDRNDAAADMKKHCKNCGE